MKNEPVAHIVFVNNSPHSMMLRPHAIELDEELIYSIPVYDKPQQPWTSINAIQFEVLAKKFGYVKEKK